MTWLVRGREGVELEVGWSEGVVGNTGSSVGGIGKVSGFFPIQHDFQLSFR